MYEEVQGLHGCWTLFTKDNSPLPHEYVLAPFTAINQNRIWVNIGISQGLGIPARDHALVLTNGSEWHEYRFGEHGLPSKATDYMAADEHNMLWLSVPYVGICSFDGKSTALHRFGHSGLPGLALITGLHIDQSKHVFAATFGSGVYRLEKERWDRVTRCGSDLENCITVFGTDRMGCLWFTCQARDETRFLTKRSHSWDSVCALPMGHRHRDEVVCFTVDAQERIWLGRRSGGLMIWERGKWSRLTKRDCSLLYGEIQDVALDEYGNLWVGTAGGYAIFDGQDWHDWGAIRPGSGDPPVSRDVLLSASATTVSEYVYIGGFVAVDSIGRKWLNSAKGLVMFRPYDSAEG